MDSKENQPSHNAPSRSTKNRHNKPLPAILSQHNVLVERDDREINFSRKREPSSPLRPPSHGMDSVFDSKRHKRSESTQSIHGHGNNGGNVTEDEGNLLVEDGALLRKSRFKEASMNDRPSDKPPSMYLRTMPGSAHGDPSVDQLMEEYHKAQQERPTLMQTARTASRATQFSGLTHHANASISSGTTFGGSTNSKDSGFFKLGRTIASSMNPVSIWQKVRGSKENLQQEDDKVLVERQLRAEQAYSTLKKDKFRSLGRRKISQDLKAFASGFTSPPPTDPSDVLPNQRDSGIDMTDDYRKSEDNPAVVITEAPTFRAETTHRVSATPGSRKFFHLRTPSFQDLKRMASGNDLHKRASSADIRSDNLLAPSPMPAEVRSASSNSNQTLRHSKSRKELDKQAKLGRKISDLEAKLVAAKREYSSVTGLDSDEKPLPQVPELPAFARAHRSLTQRFQPMPTLVSESLLVHPDEHVAESARSSTSFNATPSLPPSPSRRHSDTVLVGKDTPPKPHVSKPVVSVFESDSADTSPENTMRKILKGSKSFVRSPSKGESDTTEAFPAYDERPTSPWRSRPKSSSGSNKLKKLRSSVSQPALNMLNQAHSLSPNDITSKRASLDTLHEEDADITALPTMPGTDDVSTAGTPTPASATMHTKRAPRNVLHRHYRSMSPIKTTTPSLDSMVLPTHYRSRSASRSRSRSRSRSASPPARNFSRPSTSPARKRTQSGLPMRASGTTGGGSPARAGKLQRKERAAPVPRLAPNRESWEWPDDVF